MQSAIPCRCFSFAHHPFDSSHSRLPFCIVLLFHTVLIDSHFYILSKHLASIINSKHLSYEIIIVLHTTHTIHLFSFDVTHTHTHTHKTVYVYTYTQYVPYFLEYPAHYFKKSPTKNWGAQLIRVQTLVVTLLPSVIWQIVYCLRHK
jgi:hypothetical protein